jgi:tryptophan synthase alpha chain
LNDGLGRAFTQRTPALVAYVMAGYPDRTGSLEALRALVRGGVDLIELGVPYADPLADGPVIRDAAETARSANPGGFGLAETIELAAEFLGELGESAPPLALMTYLNPLMRAGLAQVAESMRRSGISGVIVPDLPPEMAPMWLSVSAGIDTVFLVAPTSTAERLEKVGETSRGFVYCVSTTGVTGERSELPDELAGLVSRVKASTRLPVAVGFGVSTPEQASLVAAVADGVVVGSALVRRQHDSAQLETVCAAFAHAVHTAR